MKCAHCGIKIPKDFWQLKIKRNTMPAEWYHPHCFIRELNYMYANIEQIKGRKN